MDFAGPIKPGQGITEAETSAHPNLRNSLINPYLNHVYFGWEITSDGANVISYADHGCLWGWNDMVQALIFWMKTYFSSPDQVPNSHLNQSHCWTCTQGNTSGFIWEMFLLGLMALPGDWFFCFGLIQTLVAELCHLLQSRHKTAARKGRWIHSPC